MGDTGLFNSQLT